MTKSDPRSARRLAHITQRDLTIEQVDSLRDKDLGICRICLKVFSRAEMSSRRLSSQRLGYCIRCHNSFHRNHPKLPERTLNTLSRWQKAYIACAVDTEGCCTVVGSSPSASLQITNTNRPWLEYLQTIIGGGRIICHSSAGRKKYAYYLYFRRHEIQQIVPQILPYIRIKKNQAKLLTDLAFLPPRSSRDERIRIAAEIKRLNSEIVEVV